MNNLRAERAKAIVYNFPICDGTTPPAFNHDFVRVVKRRSPKEKLAGERRYLDR